METCLFCGRDSTPNIVCADCAAMNTARSNARAEAYALARERIDDAVRVGLHTPEGLAIVAAAYRLTGAAEMAAAAAESEIIR